MDVLWEYDGAKAVVLVSPVLARADVMQTWFDDVAQRAAASRVAIYPARARWMTAPTTRRGTSRSRGGAGGTRILSQLAHDSGGRMSAHSDDLSIAYAAAQLKQALDRCGSIRIERDLLTQHGPQSVGVGAA